MNYKERLEKLNDKNDTVWNSIDKPMRRLIFEMNRCGMVTKFCCFGCEYGEDDVPKSHCTRHAYVLFHLTELGISNFQKVKEEFKQLFDSKLLIIHVHGNMLHLIIKDSLDDYFYTHDENMEAIHKYEQYAMTVYNIAGLLQSLPGTDYVEIIDGNSTYIDIESWQIDPKPNFEISTEEFYLKFGKIDSCESSIVKFHKENKIVDINSVVEILGIK
jgi:hypothetical protein